jgi:ParB family chromosome partitioning protein
MSEKRRGLGRGLGALIPSSAANGAGNAATVSRPVDLFFPEGRKKVEPSETEADTGVEADEPENVTEPAKSGTRSAVAEGATSRSEEAEKPVRKSGTGAKSAQAVKPGSTKGSSQKVGNNAGSADVDRVDSPDDSRRQQADNGIDLLEVPGVRFAEIPVGEIHPNRKQPRSVFDEDDMAELVHSVREIGVLQPIVVRKSTESGSEPYELVMGERRWRAVQAAGLETIPAIVRDTTDDDLLRDALLENLHRSQLNPLEEAAAYQQLLEDFGTTHEQLADRIGRSRPQVSNTLRLLKLPPLVQRRVAAGVLSAGHARALLALPDAAAMERLAQKIVAEGMSVRATEEAVTLHQDPAKPAKNNIPRPGARHERLDYLASSLSDRLDTNVKISLGVRKGKVSIEFASVEDLNRIMDVLAPGSNN